MSARRGSSAEREAAARRRGAEAADASGEGAAGGRLREVGLTAALFLATFLAYGPALRGGFVWDDDAYVEHNRTLRDGAGLRSIWLEPRSLPQYYPLVHTTFWCEYQAFGPRPVVFHVTNVALHALNAWLVGRLLVRLGVPGAWFAAWLFALHPVHVESVAWITERKNVLSACLYLTSALAFLRFNHVFDDERPRARGWYVASLALFAGALLSKTVTATLPPALLVAAWYRRGRVTRGDVLAVLPMFALAIPLGLHTAWLEKHHVGASGPDWEWSFVERALIAGRAVWFYAAKLVAPRDLAFIYPRWRIDAAAPWQYLFPFAAVALVAALAWRRDRLGRGPLAAALYFGGTLFPALGFFNVYPMRYSFVADHFQYLASIGLLALLAAAATTWLRRPERDFRSLVAAGVLAVLGLITWGQSSAYLDLETLWTDTLRKNPDCVMALTNLGGHYLGQGRLDEAEPLLRRSLELAPNEALAHNHLGAVLGNSGRVNEALVELREAVRLDPEYAEAHGNLGALLIDHGDRQEALAELNAAIRLRPREPAFHRSLARWSLAEGDEASAARATAEADRLERP